jgi:hypothetical protein
VPPKAADLTPRKQKNAQQTMTWCLPIYKQKWNQVIARCKRGSANECVTGKQTEHAAESAAELKVFCGSLSIRPLQPYTPCRQMELEYSTLSHHPHHKALY